MKRALIIAKLIAVICLPHLLLAQNKPREIIRTKVYTVFADSVVQQDRFTATVLSPKAIVSNYKSPANKFKSPLITFKFSINGKDNEMVSGTDHHFTCITNNGYCETPIIKFGTQLKDNMPLKDNTYLAPNTRLKIRVDLSEVFDQFERQGYYRTFNGNKIYKEDFKGVYVAGNTEPLIWDFDNLVNHPELRLNDEQGNHLFETTLVLNAHEDERKTDARWQLTRNISAFPQYTSAYPISDALYNMSLEEMLKAVEPDSTFRTGKEWSGVWTRDISYSIILSLAYLQPRVARISLLRKVNGKGRIIQDTGTGGAYPCSTDRVIWAVAAWEIYKATGDKNWLRQAYLIIKNSIDDDAKVAYDHETGLVKGESTFLDWREQTYPKWMQPADIFESECLGTNAVHYQANYVLSQMALLLHDKETAIKHAAIASQIKNGINKYLWLPDKGYYAQFLYGRSYKIVSPRAEALGEALCVLWGIADSDMQKQIISKTPVTDFGITCIYPQIPNIPPYHNNAVWPFVQTFWIWAAVKAGNENAVIKGIGDIYRPAAMFLTNKENFVAEDGDFSGTQINSSNMLWSLSANISIIHKVLFGMRFNEDFLSFEPFVPKSLGGVRKLMNFKYRNAILNITMSGYGNKIVSIMMDGRPLEKASLPAYTAGRHSITIKLGGFNSDNMSINTKPVYFSPDAPVIQLYNNNLVWMPVSGAKNYIIIKNGQEIDTTSKTSYNITSSMFAEYQVIAVDKSQIESFASEPEVVVPENDVKVYEMESFMQKSAKEYKGFSGEGFIEIAADKNRNVVLPVNIDTAGYYSIDFSYANGNGPINTENKCAIRTLKIDDKLGGTIVFPQRGKNEWSNWGCSNSIKIYLTKGKHIIKLCFEDFDDNMNGDTNQAMIDFMRIVKIN